MKKKKLWMVPAGFAILIILGFFLYVSDYYRAGDKTLKALESDSVSVTQAEYGWFFDGPAENRCLMSNWMIYCAETWLAPLYDKLHILLLQAEIINADETELQVLREPGRKAQTKSYMWLYRTGSYAEIQIILYEYQPGRGSQYPLNILAGFKGYLQTDGYVGYEALKEAIHVGCLSHLKRKFQDAVTALPNGKKSGAAVEGEAYCEKLFLLERAFANLPFEERKKKRQELAKPILDEFLAWGATRTASSKSKLGEALTYLHNNGKELSQYLNDGRLEISNNIAERSIKPFVIDRKTFCFPTPPKVLLQVPSRSASSRLPSQTILIPMPISPTSSPKLLKWLETAKIGLKLCSRKMLRIPARQERRSAPKLDAYATGSSFFNFLD